MSDRDEEATRESESPGAGDSRFQPPDPEYDYSSQPDEDDWSEEPGEAEAVLQSIRQESVAGKGSPVSDDVPTAEAELSPVGEDKPVKRYLLREPTEAKAVNRIVKALTSANHFALVSEVVAEPDIYRQRWDREHTELERERLWSLCCDFLHAEELVDLRTVRAAEEKRRNDN